MFCDNQRTVIVYVCKSVLYAESYVREFTSMQLQIKPITKRTNALRVEIV